MSEEIKLTIDTDKITVDAFLELVELNDSTDKGAKFLRRMIELLQPAVTNLNIGSLPYSQLKPMIEQIMAALNGTVDPN